MATADSIWAYARRSCFERYGSQADQEILDAVNDAISLIAQERLWPRYQQIGALTFVAPEEHTLTLVLDDATVTTAGTWPTDLTGYALLIDDHLYAFSSRTSDTVAELDAAWPFASATKTATLVKDSYALPDDCWRIFGLHPGSSWIWGGLQLPATEVWMRRASVPYAQEYPTAWGVAGNRLLLYPYPSEAARVSIIYYRAPTLPTDGADVLDVDGLHLPLLHRAVDYQMALRYGAGEGGPLGTLEAQYQRALARAVSLDNGPQGFPALGSEFHTSKVPDWRRRRL